MREITKIQERLVELVQKHTAIGGEDLSKMLMDEGYADMDIREALLYCMAEDRLQFGKDWKIVEVL